MRPAGVRRRTSTTPVRMRDRPRTTGLVRPGRRIPTPRGSPSDQRTEGDANVPQHAPVRLECPDRCPPHPPMPGRPVLADARGAGPPGRLDRVRPDRRGHHHHGIRRRRRRGGRAGRRQPCPGGRDGGRHGAGWLAGRGDQPERAPLRSGRRPGRAVELPGQRRHDPVLRGERGRSVHERDLDPLLGLRRHRRRHPDRRVEQRFAPRGGRQRPAVGRGRDRLSLRGWRQRPPLRGGRQRRHLRELGQ